MNENKVAIITGGSHGIGQGIALRLADDGYDIAFTYYEKTTDDAEKTKLMIEEKGRKAYYLLADMREPDAGQMIVDAAYKEYGRIDAMIICAGLDGRHSVLTATQKDLDDFLHMNLRGNMLLCGAAARYMVKDKIPGNIIFITSSRGERAYADDFIYGMTKAAIYRACKSIAIDLSPYGIRANCVAPGATWTHEGAAHETLKDGGVPMGRIGTPKDAADLVAFLISDQAPMITGIQVRVDGGLILSGLPEGWAKAQFINPAWVEDQHDKVIKFFEDREQ